jgi:nitronate monooxygenase
MALATAFTDMFGIEHPIALAPMGGVSGGDLARAVSEAGGLGLIGGGYCDPHFGYGSPEWFEAQFDAAGNHKVGVGFITWSLAQHPESLDVVLARNPAAVMLSFGEIAPFADRIKACGAKLVCQVQTLSGAKEAVEMGADVIVAQGTEAGGHGSSGRTVFSLVPAVVDAVGKVPVLAAGAVSDGRGLAAALMLGASGVLVGTRFFAAEEASGLPRAKQRIVEAGGDQTLRTRVFDIARDLPWPQHYTGRAIENVFSDAWHGREAGLETALAAERLRYAEAAKEGDIATSVVFAGEGIDLVRDVRPAREIVRSMADEAEALLSGAASFSRSGT